MGDPLDVADALFAAISAGDLESVQRVYADDAVIWHNYDGIEQTPTDNLRTLQWMVSRLGRVDYTQVRRAATPDGFVQQHVLVATNRRGEELAIPACIVCTVADGRIVRLDEYLDSAHVAAITAK